MAVRSTEGNWFLIMCTWDIDADEIAVQRFYDLYDYLKVLAPPEEVRQEALAGLPRDDPRLTLVPDSLKSLNLIGRRTFVIVCQIISEKSNRLLQELSKKISLGAPINVEIFPATFVHDLIDVLPPRKA